jgi:hypothetical protein
VLSSQCQRGTRSEFGESGAGMGQKGVGVCCLMCAVPRLVAPGLLGVTVDAAYAAPACCLFVLLVQAPCFGNQTALSAPRRAPQLLLHPASTSSGHRLTTPDKQASPLVPETSWHFWGVSTTACLLQGGQGGSHHPGQPCHTIHLFARMARCQGRACCSRAPPCLVGSTPTSCFHKFPAGWCCEPNVPTWQLHFHCLAALCKCLHAVHQMAAMHRHHSSSKSVTTFFLRTFKQNNTNLRSAVG